MKKIIAVFLSVVMLFGCMAVTASAALEYGAQVSVGTDSAGREIYQYEVTGQCDCHTEGEIPASCRCCPFCPRLDKDYLTDCAKDSSGNFDGTLCCENCVGVWPCSCGCSCCADNKDLNDLDNIVDEYWDEEDQKNFVEGFQAILKQISDAFDKFFDAIFEFLRLDEILGTEE